MKILALVLSIATLFYLAVDLVEDGIDQKTTSNQTELPQLLELNPLAKQIKIEKHWLKQYNKSLAKTNVKPKKNKVNKPIKNKVTPENQPTLNIAGIDYKLLGIFNNSELPFIVLKAPQKKRQRVNQGAELSPGSLLFKVTENMIIVKINNEFIEFKLFERNKNV